MSASDIDLPVQAGERKKSKNKISDLYVYKDVFSSLQPNKFTDCTT